MISKETPALGASVREALAAGRARLGGTADALFDANVLLRDACGRDAAWLLAHGDAALDEPSLVRYDEALARRARGEPVAYITGESWFYGRRFEVNASVLVPRPETEQLLEAALRFLDAHANGVAGVCDVGTGSGILAVSLACERAQLAVVALDRSREALEVARRNAGAHGVEARVDFLESDLFDALPAGERFACIVANLPYVRSSELLPAPDPTAFEPRLALDGGADGLRVYRRFLDEAPERLAPGGGIFLEAAPDTAAALASLAAQRFPAKTCRVLRDYAGLERIVAVTD